MNEEENVKNEGGEIQHSHKQYPIDHEAWDSILGIPSKQESLR